MTDRLTVDQRNTIKAKELFEAACDHASQGNFEEAKKLYKQSLHLREDAVVRNAYLELLATIGPM